MPLVRGGDYSSGPEVSVDRIGRVTDAILAHYSAELALARTKGDHGRRFPTAILPLEVELHGKKGNSLCLQASNTASTLWRIF